ncbi:hypothetical protein PACTADRAFT_74519 [Pachysolen tannophilus NRRL Y-2460]|uniref:C2H2-type domain-containing protein n=1 Tax=Pachysolen tannophilus NRRL Y-2460 TaxID=669874 RepID=A0A1E4TYW2_PACTA|nr:hypothetical protein PACTADRAFT_74519 [Pachysolen tannophilus NRRL Y-2460]
MHYTCNSCGLGFAEPDDQRAHMKSEWHRYNLKRRVAQLPAVTEDAFNSKLASLSINDETKNNSEDKDSTKGRSRKGGKSKEEVQKTITKKEQRRREKEELLKKKNQLLESAGISVHNKADKVEKPILEEKELNSIEEIANDHSQTFEVLAAQEPLQEEDLTEEQLLEEKLKNRVEIPKNHCLFCNKKYPNLDESVNHMFKNHGLYIPEQKYLVDKEGLIQYLSEKIGLGNICIVCSYQGRSIEAVRAHMLSKSHCKIPYETEDEKLEISEFYDFSSTYQDSNSPSKSKIVIQDAKESTGEEDDEWEDVDSEDEESTGDLSDGEVPQELSYYNGYELHLPSGAVVGHRSLQRYYRQNLRPDLVLSEGQGTVIAAETRRLASLYDKKALAERKRIWKRQSKANDTNDRRAAKFINNQPHYRDQLLQ